MIHQCREQSRWRARNRRPDRCRCGCRRMSPRIMRNRRAGSQPWVCHRWALIRRPSRCCRNNRCLYLGRYRRRTWPVWAGSKNRWSLGRGPQFSLPADRIASGSGGGGARVITRDSEAAVAGVARRGGAGHDKPPVGVHHHPGTVLARKPSVLKSVVTVPFPTVPKLLSGVPSILYRASAKCRGRRWCRCH